MLGLLAVVAYSRAATLGDIDGNGRVDVFDLVRLQNQVRTSAQVSEQLQVIGDLNQDGLVGSGDIEPLINTILGISPLVTIPSAAIRDSSPRSGEGNVALTRETIVRFTQPLSPTNILGTNCLFAEFGGRRILSRIELGSDRRSLTLFYLEPLPSSARVRVTLIGDYLVNIFGVRLDADGDGIPGGTRQIEFDSSAITPVVGTATIGQVFASEMPNGTNVPLRGVTVTVDGAEQTLRAVTDANGRFSLSPCPAGRFFVHVDGRTVTNLGANIHYPNKSYYPFVGKAWEAQPGYTNNLAGGDGLIFLPLIVQGTLQVVSQMTNTTVTFPPSVIATNPALAGVSIMVPAGSLFSDNGTRGGKVGIAAVDPDRLPETLPPGLGFSLVITIQTDGPSNFGEPVPVRFPNLPDPITGELLAPGAKSALWSFNHDTGVWQMQGPMTVTADGRFVECDAGVGARQPGWHGQRPDTKFECFPALGWTCDRQQQLFDVTGINLGGRARLKVGLIGASLFDFGLDGTPASNGFVKVTPSTLYTPAGGVGWVAVDGSPVLAFNREARPSVAFEDLDNIGSAHAWFAINVPNGVYEVTVRFGDADEGRSPMALIIEGLLRGNFSTAPGQFITAEVRTVVRDNRLDIEFGTFDGTLATVAWISANRVGEVPETPQSPLTPPFMYALENLENGFIQRGHYLSDADLDAKLFLATRTRYRFHVLHPASLSIGEMEFSTSTPGVGIVRPAVLLHPLGGIDSDTDGLPDSAEFVLGTDANNPDTDNDGIPDRFEVQQGTDPLSNLAVATGILSSTDTRGNAVDVCVGDNLAVVANSSDVVIFNAASSLNPIRSAQVPVPGNVMRVACSDNFVVAACDSAGLAILDVSNPSRSYVFFQLSFGANVKCVTAAVGVAYAGLSDGRVVAVDMASGTTLDTANLGGDVHDLGIGGESLFVLTANQLSAFDLTSGTLELQSSVAVSGFIPEGVTQRKRLFVGSDYAYVTSYPGYDTIDVRNPANLRRIGSALDGGPNSFKQIAVNGSGLGIAAVGVNSGQTGPGTHDIWLYDVSNPTNTSAFITSIETPGIARAVAIYNGLAYVADGNSGLHVINYRAYDTLHMPPTIMMGGNLAFTGPTNALAEEGKLVRLSALVTDDVQVRNVEFYVDGTKVGTDVNFPFEYRFVSPKRDATRTNFVVRAKATDTGGNIAWTPEINVALVTDFTPPRPRRTFPGGTNTVADVTDSVFVYFSEPIDAATLTSASFQLTYAGADNLLGTADDMVITNGTVSFRQELNLAKLSFLTPLPYGLYRGLITSNVTDIAGNALTNNFTWTFWVLPGGPDGDADHDDLSNAEEVARGTNPFNPDTDGDGWVDGVEVADGKNPLDPNSRPKMIFVGAPPVRISIADFDETGKPGNGTFVAQPPVKVSIAAFDETGQPGIGTVIGYPAVRISIPAFDETGIPGIGTTIGSPPVRVSIPAFDETGQPGTGTTIGRPPISVRYQP